LTKKIKEERRERKTKLTKNKRKEKKNFFFQKFIYFRNVAYSSHFYFLAGVKLKKKRKKKK